MPLITASNITKKYADLQVLKGVGIQVEKSEVISVVGKSGAGKSTLLHIIGTLDKADTGSVIIDDVDVKQLSEVQLAKFRNQKLGFIFQFHHLLPEFTALENAAMPGLIAGKSESQAYSRAKELLDYLGLSHRMEHKPGQLSGGEQQRVAVARSLQNSPKVVFADEPSGNLDTQSSQELHELFFKLRNEMGQTFVIVTHNEALANMSDRKLVMADGLMLDTNV